MVTLSEKVDLPLLWQTPSTWATGVLTRPLLVLNDHAHLEKKAAANAMELLNRWPDRMPPEHWVLAMTAIARDEIEHLSVVTRLLSRRGGILTRSHRNPYAASLRKLVRMGQGPFELIDRLLISALIEARSCERFFVLSEHCADLELAKLYRGLYASEAGHYHTFLKLAKSIPDSNDVDQRWQEMLQTEAALIQQQPPGFGMHSAEPLEPN